MDSHLPSGFAVKRVQTEASMLNAAMIGVSPYEQEDDSFLGTRKPSIAPSPPDETPGKHPSGGSEVEMFPLQSPPAADGHQASTTAYQGGGHYQAVGGAPAMHNPGSGYAQHWGLESQPAWQHWNSTGW